MPVSLTRPAYLKAHYPSEYMAAVLSRNLANIEQLTLYMNECKRMGISVLGPDINESMRHLLVQQGRATCASVWRP